MMIKYFEKNKNNSIFAFDQELFKVLKQINTIQFVINQMFIELSTFKNSLTNHLTDIEKYHHNCKVEEIKPQNIKNFRFSAQFLADDSDNDETEPEKEEQKRSNMNVYRVWKE